MKKAEATLDKGSNSAKSGGGGRRGISAGTASSRNASRGGAKKTIPAVSRGKKGESGVGSSEALRSSWGEHEDASLEELKLDSGVVRLDFQGYSACVSVPYRSLFGDEYLSGSVLIKLDLSEVTYV